MSKNKADFGTGSMPKLILKQALPLALSQVAQLLYNIVDRIYIGHIEKDSIAPLTGLGLTFPIISAVLAFTLLFGQGGSPVFSITRGEGDTKKAQRIMGNSFTLLALAGIILTIIISIFAKPLLYLLGAGADSFPYAYAYLRIYILGTTLVTIGTGMNCYISAQGAPITAMITVMSGAILNLILDPIFIFKLNLGIRGAAIATLISQFVSCIWVLRFFIPKFGGKAVIPLSLKSMALNGKIVGSIIAMGFTGFVMEITNSITQVTCNRTLRLYGGEIYVGIMTIVNSVRSIMGVAVNGIVQGAQPVLGYNYGARKYNRVRAGIRYSSLFAFAYTAVAWAVVFFFPGFFIGLFSSDLETNAIAIPYLHIFFMAYVFMSLQFSGQSTFMALGKAKRAIFFSLFRKVVLVVPLTLFLPTIMPDPVSGVFYAEPISNVIGGAASFTAMYLTIYRKLPQTDS